MSRKLMRRGLFRLAALTFLLGLPRVAFAHHGLDALLVPVLFSLPGCSQ